MESVAVGEKESARLAERDWQREHLPSQIRDLVLNDKRLRNELCWSVFSEMI
jgi:hypothetical protein